MKLDISNSNKRATKTITLKFHPSSTFKGYMETQIRYLNYICSLKHIDMLCAIERYSYLFKWLYLQKHIF